MKIDSVIADIVNIASEWGKGKPFNFDKLLSQSGYYDYTDTVNEDVIKNYLLKHEHHVRSWIQFSEDKRTSSGWFIMRRSETSYDVGFVEEKGGHSSEKHFSDKFDACAHFIYREITTRTKPL